jgi:hypothetical protein
MAYFTHRFETTIRRHAVGSYHYTVVYLPDDIARAMPFAAHPRLRIEADVGGVPVKGAWQPAKGVWYLMLPKAGLKAAALAIGDDVEVAFRVIAQDDVDVPAELAAALSKSAKRRKAWEAHTAGTQRGLAHFVESAKRAETRAARLEAVLAALDGTAELPWARRDARRRPRAP